ncbi:SDR family oxidoreductase [Dyella choica]|uniref:SDR family oxidoreductase n=1 Tax=Dyella choica TaxID=1927959 RepID=A0A432M9F3_9GAMM|nr:SDR family oxidoreductase [Dyella choica]RUL78854.1 SDR family oxidoreductase [Dyella choica]
MNHATDERENRTARRVVLVFGGSRSVDAAIVDRLAGEGFAVARVCIARRSRGHEQHSYNTASNEAVTIIEVDDTQGGWIPDVIARTVTQLGPPHAVVIHAGLLQFASSAAVKLDDLELRLGSHVHRVYEVIQRVATHMHDGGRIVTVAASATEWNGATAAVLSMARAAVAALVKGLALDLAARRIVVNNIQPGPIDTDMASEYAPHLDGRIPLGWVGKPHEIASLVAYLAGEASGSMTGASITIDGGFAL